MDKLLDDITEKAKGRRRNDYENVTLDTNVNNTNK